MDFSYRIKSLARVYQITLVSNRPLTEPELQVQGADYVVLPGGVGRMAWLRYLWHCARLIRTRSPEVAVLLHSTVAPVALLCGNIATVTYWNEHPSHFSPAPAGRLSLKNWMRHVLRWLLFEGARRSSIVMPIGEAHREDLLQHGCLAERISLLYMGVDPTFYQVALPPPVALFQFQFESATRRRQASDEDSTSSTARSERGSQRSSTEKMELELNAPLRLLYIGSVSPARGRDIMLEAIAQANAETAIATITLVGACEVQQRYCRDYAQRLGIADAVTVVGRVSGYRIPDFLRAADAGLCLWEDQPWWRFNPPTKLFEYLVAGLPVLASNIGTHTQYITDQSNGLIFEYDSSSLAAAIRQLWQRRAEIPAFKQRAADSGEQYLWPGIEPAFLHAVQRAQR